MSENSPGAITRHNPSPLRQMDTFAGDIGMQVWTSLPDTKRGLLVELLQGGAESLADVVGETIPVEHIVAHNVEMVDEKTGEITEANRIVLLTPSGKAYAAVSVGIRKSIATICALYGPPIWKPALHLKVNQIRTRRGFTTYMLAPVDAE